MKWSYNQNMKLTLGWREWVGLPQWGIPAIKAKIDTGARTSSLHALDAEPYLLKGQPFVRFLLMPVQRSLALGHEVSAPMADRRRVKSSNGESLERFVINVDLKIADKIFSTEVTLANRRDMKFRMLLGRQALQAFLVDPAESYLLGRSLEQQEFLKQVRLELLGK